jgi:superfamily II DNA/RNA helicase
MPTFAELGLPESVQRALDHAGFTEPFPIQAATLPDAIAGRDVLGKAQTGSGKTLAFGLAALSRLAGDRSRSTAPRGLVLVPTRELAQQVVDALDPFARALGVRTAVVVGGTSMNRQIDALRRGVDLLVATPGRLSDHIRSRTADMSEVTFTAIDEADRMADMGFMPQVTAILDLTTPGGQRLLFSATLDGEVDKLVRRYLTDPVVHSVVSPSTGVDTMEHHLLLVSAEHKPLVVAEVAARDGRTILFVRTKHSVDRLVKKLRAVGIVAGGLHGGKAQGARTRMLGDFTSGRSPVLVATDVAARGIHVDDISLVVHVDPPPDPKDYMHRAGRTARAGASGTVITLVTPGEQREVQQMTGKAGVRARSTQVRPGDPELVRITGARLPSGVPVAEPAVQKQNPPRKKRGPRNTDGALSTNGRSTNGRSTNGRSGNGRSANGRSGGGRSGGSRSSDGRASTVWSSGGGRSSGGR